LREYRDNLEREIIALRRVKSEVDEETYYTYFESLAVALAQVYDWQYAAVGAPPAPIPFDDSIAWYLTDPYGYWAEPENTPTEQPAAATPPAASASPEASPAESAPGVDPLAETPPAAVPSPAQ
jgi:hypothetical protein